MTFILILIIQNSVAYMGSNWSSQGPRFDSRRETILFVITPGGLVGVVVPGERGDVVEESRVLKKEWSFGSESS